MNQHTASSDHTAGPEEMHASKAKGHPQPGVWVVRADSDEQASRFADHGYTGIGWLDLSPLNSRDQIWERLKKEHPNEGSLVLGQLKSFRLDMLEGDYVITPTQNSESMHCGVITGPCERYVATDEESIQNCRKVEWRKGLIPQTALSEPLRQTLRSNPQVFRIKQKNEFLDIIERSTLAMDAGGLEREPEDPNQESFQAPFDSSKIKVQTVPVLVGQLISRLDYDEIDLSPEFQRSDGVWDNTRRSRLIESLLLRIPIPLFYVAADVNDDWSVVDGVQRISTIYDFVKNKFPLTRLEYRNDLNDKLHRQLPRSMQRRIDETQLVMNVIQPGTPEEVMFNIFNRINTGGVPLTAQEVRNALVKGPVRNYLKRLAESDQFLKATANSVNAKRMADRECVLRFLAFYITPWENYAAKSLDAHLVKTMKIINKMSENRRAFIEDRFRNSMLAAARIFGDNAFRKLNVESSRRSPVNKSLLETWSVQLAHCSDEQIDRLVDRRAEIVDQFSDLLRKNTEFENSISYSTGSRKRIQTRFVTIRNLIEGFLSC